LTRSTSWTLPSALSDRDGGRGASAGGGCGPEDRRRKRLSLDRHPRRV
jgi:hypothetical protein